MNIQEIKDILSNIQFAPSNIEMGWEWDVKLVKIYDDDNVEIESGYSIRTTFMRPDSNSGEIEKGYGRWMYVPSTISKDGLVKTAWLCVELIVKHELMEAFLFNKKRIFDPHKTLDDLSYNSDKVENTISTKVFGGETQSSAKIIPNQNLINVSKDIEDYIKSKNFSLVSDDDNVKLYNSDIYLKIEHDLNRFFIRIIEENGNVKEVKSGETYLLDDVKNMIDTHFPEELLDPAEVNLLIMSSDYKESQKKNNDGDDLTYAFIHKNPNKKKIIIHDQKERAIAVCDNQGNVITELSGDNYKLNKIKKILL